MMELSSEKGIVMTINCHHKYFEWHPESDSLQCLPSKYPYSQWIVVVVRIDFHIATHTLVLLCAQINVIIWEQKKSPFALIIFPKLNPCDLYLDRLFGWVIDCVHKQSFFDQMHCVHKVLFVCFLTECNCRENTFILFSVFIRGFLCFFMGIFLLLLVYGVILFVFQLHNSSQTSHH